MKLLRNVLAIIGCFVLGTTVSFEFRHWYNYGHLVSYGLHVDAVNRDAYIGIPGQTKMYWPEVTNFSLLPVRLPACQYSVCFGASLDYAHALQRYDDQSKTWETIGNPGNFQFCVNPETNESQVVYTYLLPGSSVEVMSGSAVGAIDGFRQNDLARWVVFREVSTGANWDTAIASAPFRIEDDVQKGEDGSFRVQH